MRVFALIVSLSLGAPGVPALAQDHRGAQERGMGGVGVLVFQDANYRGRNATFRDEVPQLGAFGLDNRISSLRVAPGEAWEVCEQPWFRGRCQVFYGDEPNLQLRGWNDRISSMRPIRGGGGWRPPRPGVGRQHLTLFDNRNFRGRSMVVAEPREFIGSFSAGSATAEGPWQLCDQPRFNGNCVVVTSSEPDLGRLGLRGRVQSARPAAVSRPY